MKRVVVLPLVVAAMLLVGAECVDDIPERTEAQKQLSICNRIAGTWLTSDEVAAFNACLNDWMEKYGGESE